VIVPKAPEPPRETKPPEHPPSPETPRPPEPVPPAPPEVRPEPKPIPPVDAERKSPSATTTLPVLATLERVAGEVYIVSGGTRSPAKSAQGILAGQSLETSGPGAEAVVVYRDLTRLSLAADARVAEFSDRRVSLGRGTVAIDLTGPFIVETPQAEVRSSSAAYVVLSCDGESTRLDVGAGKVRLSRLADGRAIDVSNGQFATVAPGSDLAAKALFRQDNKKKKGKKDLEFELKVNAAIQSGVAFLKEQAAQATLTNMPDGGFPVELALWALQRGGLPESDPVFQKLFQHMMTTDLQRTYRVSLQAMILEELDRVKYQNRIAQSAQFLIDNQARNGQWNYGEPVPPLDMTPTAGAKPRKEVATPGGKTDSKEKEKEKKEKPKVVTKITLAKRRDGPAQGDNSNSQYAALGLRACHDAGIILPQEVLKRAQTWWRGAQEATKKGEAAGWTYGEAASPGGRTSYGSMTAGAAGSLVMYHYMLGEPWMKDDAILKGLEWMIGHFTVTENPGLGDPKKREEYTWHYYYLYALERLGIMYGTDTLGAHDWYMEGATFLVKAQKPNGSWEGKPGDGFMTHDTCFAILFLRRATRPLLDVASVDKGAPPK